METHLQLRRVFRVNLMREINELDVTDIIMMFTQGLTKSNSSISNYFKYEEGIMEQESRPRRIAHLAIILNIPVDEAFSLLSFLLKKRS